MSHHAATSAGWAPVPFATVRHIVDRMTPHPGIDGDLHALTELFLAPAGSIPRFATRRRDFGQVAAVLVSASALRVRRGLPSTSGTAHVVFVVSGSLTLRPPEGEPIEIGIGGMCSIGDWDRYEGECSDGTRALYLMIPEARLRARGIRHPEFPFRVSRSGSLGMPLRNFTLSVLEPSWHPTDVGALVAERTIEDLLVGIFLEHEARPADHAEETRELVTRALAVIAQHHVDPQLRPSSVASRLAVSLRHLQRAFGASGITVAHSISQARVRSATLLLSGPSGHHLTMAQIAELSGFRSTFELRSAFRAEYDQLPSEFRELERAKVVPGHAQSHAIAPLTRDPGAILLTSAGQRGPARDGSGVPT